MSFVFRALRRCSLRSALAVRPCTSRLRYSLRLVLHQNAKLIPRTTQAGFTLIEVIIVMAISSSLLMIALVGQREIRARASFDAAVNKVVATVADAHNQAKAGVNVVGAGNGSTTCSGTGGQYIFAGVAWTADSGLPGSPFKMDYYKAVPGGGACVFDSRNLSLPSDVEVRVGTQPGGRVLFVRTANGGLAVCPVTNLFGNTAAAFGNGTCNSGSLTLDLTDAEGHTSQVIVDSSGLARRMF